MPISCYISAKHLKRIACFYSDFYISYCNIGSPVKTTKLPLTTPSDKQRCRQARNISSAFTGLAELQLTAGNASVLVFGLGVLIVYLMLGALAFLAMRSIDLNIDAQVGLVTLIRMPPRTAS